MYRAFKRERIKATAQAVPIGAGPDSSDVGCAWREKRVGGMEFEEIFTFENMMEAANKCQKGVR